jgi:malate dehydrogenase (oxaloacetate-decarboxylating)
VQAQVVDDEMKFAAAHAIAKLLVDPEELGPDRLIPDALDLRGPPRVAAAVARAAVATGVAQAPLDPREVEARCRDLVFEGTVAH